MNEPIVPLIFLSVLLGLYVSGNANEFSLTKDVTDMGIVWMLIALIIGLALFLFLWTLAVFEFHDPKGEFDGYKVRNLQNAFFGRKFKDEKISRYRYAPLYEFWQFMEIFVEDNGMEYILMGLAVIFVGIAYLLYIKFKFEYINDQKALSRMNASNK